MNEKTDQLKQHFRRRVHDQARAVVSNWSTLREVYWNNLWFNEILFSADKLEKLSLRYNSPELLTASQSFAALLQQQKPTKAPSSEILETLNTHVQEVARVCSRANDELPLQQISECRKPIYLCFSDMKLATSVERQLSQFGIPAEKFSNFAELEFAMKHRLPAALVVDTDFQENVITKVTTLQVLLRVPVPIFFFCREEPDIKTRLAVVRANGVAFSVGQVDVGRLVQQMLGIYSMQTEPPLRVLIVDDSRAQSIYAEKILNGAGMFTRSVNEPLMVMEVIQDFQPDAILMDMYMPEIDGPELAQVIRQSQLYDALPILYLSAESDIEKQLAAVGRGGDDFLTKPVPKGVLITTVENRCRRYRGLKDQMVRDGLTGLFDHKNTLLALDREVTKARDEGSVVSFAMIDIDRFKVVNDTYGHAVGDRVIRSLALYLRQRFRATDTIGRYGGEEFAIVLPSADETVAQRLLDEARAGFERLVHCSGLQEIVVTFSCGVALWNGEEDTLSLSTRADAALYKAKNGGRNQVVAASDITD